MIKRLILKRLKERKLNIYIKVDKFIINYINEILKARMSEYEFEDKFFKLLDDIHNVYGEELTK